jgi:hypothetical protein
LIDGGDCLAAWWSIDQRHVLQPDIEVGVSVPIRPRGNIHGVRQQPGQTVVPFGGTRTRQDHPIDDLYPHTALLSTSRIAQP